MLVVVGDVRQGPDRSIVFGVMTSGRTTGCQVLLVLVNCLLLRLIDIHCLLVAGLVARVIEAVAHDLELGL